MDQSMRDFYKISGSNCINESKAYIDMVQALNDHQEYK